MCSGMDVTLALQGPSDKHVPAMEATQVDALALNVKLNSPFGPSALCQNSKVKFLPLPLRTSASSQLPVFNLVTNFAHAPPPSPSRPSSPPPASRPSNTSHQAYSINLHLLSINRSSSLVYSRPHRLYPPIRAPAVSPATGSGFCITAQSNCAR